MKYRPAFALGCALLLGFASCSDGAPRAMNAGVRANAGVSTPPRDPQALVRAAYVVARQAEGGGVAAYSVRATTGGRYVAEHPTMGLRAEFGAHGATLSKTGEAWTATLVGSRYGCVGEELSAIVRTGAPHVGASSNRVDYPGRANTATVDEWYVHGPLGIEQGFTLSESACTRSAGGDVVVEVQLDGLEPVASQDGSGMDLRDDRGSTRGRYTDLWARDAAGRPLAAKMEAVPGGIALRVDVRGAQFPVTVDPLAWFQVVRLTGTGATANGKFGSSVSISGTAAIVGDPSNGAAYVFVQSGATWIEQQQLEASDEFADAGSAAGGFGLTSVSISGATALVGTGSAAYVFVQSGTNWIQQQKLAPSDGAVGDSFGASVSLSGSTALVGAPYALAAQQGAAYVFVQSGTTWTQQLKFTANDGSQYDRFGSSVSISGDTALVGAPGQLESGGPGTVYVFMRHGMDWIYGQKLAASDGINADNFGFSVCVSGTLALVGARTANVGTNLEQGAAYVFTQSGTAFSQQQKLAASDGVASTMVSADYFGASVAISGTTALVGAPGIYPKGAAYSFMQSGTTWTQQQKLTSADDSLGSSVSISGTYALIRASNAAYVETLLSTNGSGCGAGADCGSGICVAGVCCNSACGACGDCSSGMCTTRAQGSAGDPSCSPLVCTGLSVACPTSCAHDSDCVAGDYCNGSQCAVQQANSVMCTASNQCLSNSCFGGRCIGTVQNGSSCSDASACASGFCADGVCCNGACSDPCGACDVAGSVGTCTAVAGVPHGSRTACTGAGTTCGGECDGVDTATCAYPTVKTSCGSTCSNGQETPRTCNGQGTCVQGAAQACNNLVCADSTKCKTSCAADADCIPGFACNESQCQPVGSTCVDRQTSKNNTQAGGNLTDCAPYTCDHASGACLQKCASVNDCIAPNVCNPKALCVPPPSVTSADTSGGSSGCAAAGARSKGASPVALIGIALIAMRRRRRRGIPRSLRSGPGKGARRPSSETSEAIARSKASHNS